MRRIGLVLALAIGCSSTEELEQKVTKLEGSVAELEKDKKQLSGRIDKLESDLKDQRNLERKIDDLLRAQQKTIDMVTSRVARPARREPDPSKVYAMPVDGMPTSGPADAKVTMVWAYEYACPYCERVRATVDALKARYASDLRVVYTQLVVHATTATAPAYAICAASKQRKFDRMDEVLWEKGFKARKFETSSTFSGGPCWDAIAGCPVMIEFAREARLDIPKFRTDMRGCVGEVTARQRVLQDLGANATPSFFINGRFMQGAQPIDSFAALIDEELKKANDRIAAGTRKADYYDRFVMATGLTKLDP